MLMQQKQPLMKALRRSQTSSSPSPSQSSNSSSTSASSSSTSLSSSSSSWIHLRSVFLVVAPSSASLVPSNRGSHKSPWSRRRRKHALLPKQWKSFLMPDGKLCDGGVKFLKKVRSGGVDPIIKAEVWPFLLGVYDVNSSREERESISIQNRKEYDNLRNQCLLINKCSEKKSDSKEIAEISEYSGEISQVFESGLDESVSLHGSLSLEKECSERELSEGAVKRELLESDVKREGSEREFLERSVKREDSAERELSVREVVKREGSEIEVLEREVVKRETSERDLSEREDSEKEVADRESSDSKHPKGSTKDLSQGLESVLNDSTSLCRSLSSEIESSEREVAEREGSDSKCPQGSTNDCATQSSQLTDGHAEISGDAEKIEITCETTTSGDSESTDSDTSESDEPDIVQPFLSSNELEGNDFSEQAKEKLSDPESENKNKSHTAEDFATWQRIIQLDAIRANADWAIYSPSQAAVTELKARCLADSVGLKNYDHLEPYLVFHAARLVSILEAYALYDPEIGYCQGMSDLLSPIVAVIEDDSEAFWCFVCFMKKARHNFRLDEVGIRRQLNIVSKIIRCKDSHLYSHLEKLKAEDCFFVYRMVMVLFRRELSFDQTLCLWEVIWADQAAIRAGIARSAWGRMRLRAPPNDDLLLYAIAASVLQRRKLIIEKYSSMEEIVRECNSMAGHLDVWKLLDDAHDLVVNLHNKI
ncbi:hypothetical protein SAY87_021039 [Trapa incisa]|uniref:Rab-GAP TBC domain-containing protein n=1 Tax=Trapa incisa TaxID=236973 RepID=A0AAN7JR81_9MYRT|nr:hypothetical protein SAY87_021039 [Trapa incisa]